MRVRFYFLMLFFISLSEKIFSDSEGLLLSGYFQSGTGIVHIISNDTVNNTSYTGRSTLRLNFINKDTGLAKFDGSIDFNVFYGLYGELYSYKSNVISVGEEAFFKMDIRKLYLSIRAEFFDLYLGRQLIKFGEGVVFSPLNPFSSIDFNDVNFTRIGVDSIRIRLPLGDLAYLETMALPVSDFTNSSVAVRTGFNLMGWDFSLASFYRGKYDYFSGGFSFKGDLIVGFYGEFVYHYNNTDSNIESKNFWNAMAGMDYSFLDKFIIRLEYYYHSFEKNNLNTIDLINSVVYPFISKHYFTAQLVFTPTIIDAFYLSCIDNLENESLLLMFSYQRNLYQNVNLIFNLRYLRKDITGLEIINFDSFYYTIEFNVRY